MSSGHGIRPEEAAKPSSSHSHLSVEVLFLKDKRSPSGDLPDASLLIGRPVDLFKLGHSYALVLTINVSLLSFHSSSNVD